uniref:Uncharacterized protein n=1 Tax=Anguilla anguilla TaxID=7936 RepID=A0A0E9UDD5_ANGAN
MVYLFLIWGELHSDLLLGNIPIKAEIDSVMIYCNNWGNKI